MLKFDSRDMAILAEMVVLVITFGATAAPPTTYGRTFSIPENDNLVNWENVFRGYLAVLDNRINLILIKGGSMEPTFSEDDIVMYTAVDNASLRSGDIIVFINPNNPYEQVIVHRIVGYVTGGNVFFGYRTGWGTKGDATTLDDPYLVQFENVKGRAIGVIYTSSGGWRG
ncbi:MAG: signal peptidase I [Candidatus Hadarchaeota archaeon]